MFIETDHAKSQIMDGRWRVPAGVPCPSIQVLFPNQFHSQFDLSDFFINSFHPNFDLLLDICLRVIQKSSMKLVGFKKDYIDIYFAGNRFSNDVYIYVYIHTHIYIYNVIRLINCS